MIDIDRLCKQYADILGGEQSIKHGVCSVKHSRNKPISIMGRPSHSVLASTWSFDSLDREGNALNLGETALLQEEVSPFTWHLQKNGLILSAIHNHWIFDNPRLLYAHYISIEPPLSFARKVEEAYSVLKP